jgi:hypothetical protein
MIMMNRIYIIGVWLLLLMVACKRKDTSNVMRAISGSFVSTNEAILFHHSLLLAELEDACKDPLTQKIACRWMPVAGAVRDKTSHTVTYIEDLKKRLGGLKAGDKKAMVSIMDTASINLYNTLLAYSEGASHDLYASEQEIAYCANSYCSLKVEWDPHFKPVTLLSSSYVKPGDSVQVWAGLVGFQPYRLRGIVIDGQPVETDQYDIAEYKMQAATKLGEHVIHVKYTILNGYGDPMPAEREINYTVLP